MTVVPLALQRFYAEVYQSQRKFEGASEVAELREALSSIDLLYSAIHELLTGINISRFKRGKREWSRLGHLRGAAALWLSVQFGLKPTISAISQLAEKINEKVDKDWVVHLKTGGDSFPTISNATGTTTLFVSFPNGGGLSGRWYRASYSSSRSIVSGALVARATQAAKLKFGFDPASLVLAGWEVIPYSWLLDYIVPIGQWIQSIMSRTVELSWSSCTTITNVVENVTIVPFSTTEIRVRSSRPLQATIRRKRLDRIQPSGLTGIALPSVSVTNRMTSLLNALAVLVVRQNSHSGRINPHQNSIDRILNSRGIR